MHGIGNDFVMIDGIAHPFDSQSAPRIAQQMGDRRFGVGSDGLIVADREPGSGTLRMRMWNPDGSESEMCGNGVRCFARFVHDLGYAKGNFIPVQTGAGKLTLELLENGLIRVDMGRARLTRAEIGMVGAPESSFIDQPVEVAGITLLGTAVSMGNPHLVVFVDNVSSVPLAEWGPKLEVHPLFPNRVNVHFVEASLPTHLVQRTWERGAGMTLACGTGACAVGVAAYLTGRGARQTHVQLPGGTLDIRYDESGDVFMTGPAEYVFTGEWTDERSFLVNRTNSA